MPNGCGEADGIRAQRLLNVRYLREADLGEAKALVRFGSKPVQLIEL
jgi:hypothetical protein